MSENIREPAVAGQFYDANPEKLKRHIKGMLDTAPETAGDASVQALIVPHAGYVFSGATAAKTFAAGKKNKYRKALIIAPSHQVHFTGLASSFYNVYKTPLGNVPVDIESIKKIESSGSSVIKEFTRAHTYEHSLEVQLPFLQTLFSGLSILPLICGQVNDEIAEDAANVLLSFWNNETLWVISSDFTHFGRSFGYVPFTDNVAECLEDLDIGAVKEIERLDCNGFCEYIERTGATICGNNPIKILLKTAELAVKKGEKIQAKLIEYTNSGKLTGDYSHCVGYAGIAFYRL